MDEMNGQADEPSRVDQDAAPELDPLGQWEAVVSSGDCVLWRADRCWSSPEAAKHDAALAMCGRMRPTAYESRGRGWRACIVIRAQGRQEERDLTNTFSEVLFPTMTDAWRHAAQVLASAEASARKSLPGERFATPRPQKSLK